MVWMMLGLGVLCGCRVKKSIESTHTAVETEYRETIVSRKDTIMNVALPPTAVANRSADTSRIETGLVTSTAWIGTDGMLNHTVEHRDSARISVPAWLEKTTTITRQDREKTTVEKERSSRMLSPWLGVLLICLMTILLLWRLNLLKFVRR